LPAGFHPHAHFHSLYPKTTVELPCFLAVLESPFLKFPCVRIDKHNLLKARVVIASYNQHIGSFSPEPFGWFAPPKLTRGWEPTLSWNPLRLSTLILANKRRKLV
jgi:hypothetical protein